MRKIELLPSLLWIALTGGACAPALAPIGAADEKVVLPADAPTWVIGVSGVT